MANGDEVLSTIKKLLPVIRLLIIGFVLATAWWTLWSKVDRLERKVDTFIMNQWTRTDDYVFTLDFAAQNNLKMVSHNRVEP